MTNRDITAKPASATSSKKASGKPRKNPLSQFLGMGDAETELSRGTRRLIMQTLRKASAELGPGQKSRIGRLGGGTVTICAMVAGATGVMVAPAFGQYSAGGGNATGSTAISIGGSSTAAGQSAIAIGNTATAPGAHTVALGDLANATATSSVAIGFGSQATAQGALAIGTFLVGSPTKVVKASATNATAIGFGAQTAATDSVAFGSGANVAASATSGVAIGFDSSATLANSVAIGSGSTASATTATTNYTSANALVDGKTFSVFQAPTNGVVAIGNRQIQGLADGHLQKPLA